MLVNDQFARHVGIKVLRVDHGYAEVEMPVRDHHLNALKTVHGGAIFTLADYAFALACNSAASPSVSLAASINHLRPGMPGTTLTARAKELSTTGRVATYLVEVTDSNGEVVASFQGLAYLKRQPAKK